MTVLLLAHVFVICYDILNIYHIQDNVSFLQQQGKVNVVAFYMKS